jgi:serine/threonine protein kinase
MMIDQGAFSKIYIDKDNTVKKVYDNGSYTIPESFLNERSILSLLDHPNIIKPISFEYKNNKYSMLMKKEKGNIFTYIPDKHDVPLIIEQLLSAVNYIHSKGVIHFDIKPANILISYIEGKPVVKICDFGSSHIMMTSNINRGEIYTRWYRAPELVKKTIDIIRKFPFLKKDRIYTYANDLWALGCVIYWLLTNKHLFPCSDEYELISRQYELCIEENYTFLQNIPEEYRSLVRKLLDFDYEKRGIDKITYPIIRNKDINLSVLSETILDCRKIMLGIINKYQVPYQTPNLTLQLIDEYATENKIDNKEYYKKVFIVIFNLSSIYINNLDVSYSDFEDIFESTKEYDDLHRTIVKYFDYNLLRNVE